MPGLGGGWAAGELVREGKGAALGGRGRGTLCLSPSQMAATPPPPRQCWAGHPQVWMLGEGCNPLCAHTEDSGLFSFHQVRC